MCIMTVAVAADTQIAKIFDQLLVYEDLVLFNILYYRDMYVLHRWLVKTSIFMHFWTLYKQNNNCAVIS